MTSGDGGTLEVQEGRARAYAAGHLAARSLGVEDWQATVITNAVVDALEPPDDPRRLALVAALSAIAEAGYETPECQQAACIATAAAVAALAPCRHLQRPLAP